MKCARFVGICTGLSLLGALALPLASFAQTPTQCPALSRTLSFGSRGADVLALQKFLVSKQLLSADGATGFFGKLTQAAVQAFQKNVGLVASGSPSTTGFGLVGAKTRAALQKCSAPSASPAPPVPAAPASTNANPPAPPASAQASATSSASTTTPVSSWTTQGAGPAPIINSFFANPNSVSIPGQKALLSWNTSQAASCNLEMQASAGAYTSVSSNAAPNGSIFVSPQDTSTYSIQCFGLGDGASTSTPSSIRKNLVVAVENPVPTCAVTTDKATYAYGDTIKLSWTSKGADYAAWKPLYTKGALPLLPTQLRESGMQFLTAVADQSQTVTLAVTGVGGSNTCSVSFTIQPRAAQ